MIFSILPVPIVVAISLVACTAATLIRGYLSKNYSARLDFMCFINIITGTVGGATIALLSIGRYQVSSFTALLALAFSATIIISLLSNLKAVSIGSVSYTTVICQFSTVITAFSGLLWGETVSIFKFIGLAFMIASMVMSVRAEDGAAAKKKTISWLLYTLLSMFATAGIGLLQKTHQSSVYKEELPMFLILSFCYTAIVSAVIVVIYGIRNKKKGGVSLLKLLTPGSVVKTALVVALLFLGIGYGLNHMINLYLSGVLPTAVMFPLVNGGSLILCLIASRIFLKEKLTKKQSIGVIIGIVGVIILCAEKFIIN